MSTAQSVVVIMGGVFGAGWEEAYVEGSPRPGRARGHAVVAHRTESRLDVHVRHRCAGVRGQGCIGASIGALGRSRARLRRDLMGALVVTQGYRAARSAARPTAASLIALSWLAPRPSGTETRRYVDRLGWPGGAAVARGSRAAPTHS